MRFTAYYTLDTVEKIVYDCLDQMEREGTLLEQTSVDIWQWDMQTYQVFLEADRTFTRAHARIVEDYIHKNLNKRILVSIYRTDLRKDAKTNTIN